MTNSSAKTLARGDLFTSLPDSELEALENVTDGRDAATGIAVLVGLRRAMRACFRRGAAAHAYGPAVLSQREIAAFSLCSVDSVQRWLKTLESAAVVKITPRVNEAGDRLPAEYALLMASPHRTKLEGSPHKAATVTAQSGEGVTAPCGKGLPQLPFPGCGISEETEETIEKKETPIPFAPAAADAVEEAALSLGIDETSPQPPLVVKRLRARDPIIDALVALDGSNPLQATQPAFKRAAKALADIRAVMPSVSADEIQRRAANYATHFSVQCTASGLAANWARCDAAGVRNIPRGGRPELGGALMR